MSKYALKPTIKLEFIGRRKEIQPIEGRYLNYRISQVVNAYNLNEAEEKIEERFIIVRNLTREDGEI